jgi:hypothetical protein
MDRFFSYDGCMYDHHDTAEDARDACLSALDTFREEAGSDGWSEETTSVWWGEVRERVTLTKSEGHHPECSPEECHEDCVIADRSFDSMEEYELLPVGDGDVVTETAELGPYRKTFQTRKEAEETIAKINEAGGFAYLASDGPPVGAISVLLAKIADLERGST